MMRKSTAKKTTWGGRRPGAGRPPTDTVGRWVTIKRGTDAILQRLAKAKGLANYPGGKPCIGAIIDALAKGANVDEPEYLRAAREARS